MDEAIKALREALASGEVPEHHAHLIYEMCGTLNFIRPVKKEKS